ncbi:MAG TPA: diguanylate cyclase, partial [Candidatus Manganitrophaceae bacterium]|nr:diguanylate cyclase [Candidatus Manganitrophaceae bacterium]
MKGKDKDQKRFPGRSRTSEARRAELKRAEEEMRKLSHAVEQSDDSVVITDKDGVIEYDNPAFERRTGYSKKEALGQTPRIVKSGKQGDAFYERLWKTISEGEVFRGILVNKKKTGELYYEEKTITPLKDGRGVITHYVSTGKDITERMRAEEERARLVAILEATTDLVAIANIHGEVVYINSAGWKMLGANEVKDISKMSIAGICPEWARAIVLGEGIPAAIRDGAWSGETAFLDLLGREVPVSQVILAHKTPAGTVEFLSTIARDISYRKAQTADLEYQATHDPLTDLPNRTLFYDRLKYAILAGQREKESFALLLIDLDRFKEINDSLGHHIGDLILREVGSRLRNALRESDTVARIGGDEFALLLPNVDTVGGVLAARKILRAVEAPFAPEKLSLSIHASVGVALFPEHGADAAALLRRADQAMYHAKRTGDGYAL